MDTNPTIYMFITFQGEQLNLYDRTIVIKCHSLKHWRDAKK